MARAALAVCAALAATAVGCTTAPAERDEVVTEQDQSLPAGCRPAEVAGLLNKLFDALNRGDAGDAGVLVIDREMLRLLGRPAGGRPLRLRAVIVGMGNGLGQIEFRVAGRLVGKGAVDCETRKLVAVGLGPERTRMAPLCPRSPHRHGGAVACARHWR